MSAAEAPHDAADSSDGRGRIIDSDGRAKVYRPLPVDERRTAREAGLAAYAEGRFFEAHELMEPAWMGSAVPAERDLDQGLIKLAAAYVHAGRGNALGMRKNLEGARKRLAAVVRVHGGSGIAAQRDAGVDAVTLLSSVEETLAGLAANDRTEKAAADDSRPDVKLLRSLPPPPIARFVGARGPRRG